MFGQRYFGGRYFTALYWGAAPSGASSVSVTGLQWTSNYQYSSPSGSTGVSVTPSGSSWANSQWAEIHPGTDSPWVLTSVVATPGAAVTFEGDIGVVSVSGAISGCVPIATVKGSFQADATYGHGVLPLAIPIDNIPANSRVGVRMRKSGTSTAAWRWAIQYLKKPITGNLQVTTQPLRALPAAANGVTTSASGVAWGWGPWVELTSSAPADMVLAGLGMTQPYNGAQFELQVGKGAVSSETPLLTVKGRMNVSTVAPGYHMIPNPRDGIVAGDRVVVRFRKEGTSTTGPDVFVLYYEKPL